MPMVCFAIPRRAPPRSVLRLSSIPLESQTISLGYGYNMIDRRYIFMLLALSRFMERLVSRSTVMSHYSTGILSLSMTLIARTHSPPSIDVT